MPALIETVPAADGTYFQIVGQTPDEVQAAIFDIADAPGGCVGEFEYPRRAYSVLDGLTRWRARGFVRGPQ